MNKTFASFNEESKKLNEMTVDEFTKDAADAATFLQNELTKLFPNQAVSAKNITLLGGAFTVSVYASPKGSTNLDLLNSLGIARFMMHLSNSSGRAVPMDKFSFEVIQLHGVPEEGKLNTWGHPALKKMPYRKITGSSPMEAAKKLLKWFQQNKIDFVMP